MVTSSSSKIAISALLAILMTCTTEIVSPEKRRLCGYATTVWTRVWLLSAPYVGATSAFGQLGKRQFFKYPQKHLSKRPLFSSTNCLVASKHPGRTNHVSDWHASFSREVRDKRKRILSQRDSSTGSVAVELQAAQSTFVDFNQRARASGTVNKYMGVG